MLGSWTTIKPDFISIDGFYACFWFDKDFKTVIVPLNELKDYKNYAEEYQKVFGYYPEKINNYSFARILCRLKRNC